MLRPTRRPAPRAVVLPRVAAVAAGAARPGPRPARRRSMRYAERHVGVVRGHDRPGHRPAGRQPLRRRDDERPDLDHQHRRLHVEHARRRAARDHRPRARRSIGSRDAGVARDDGAPRAERPVLQLVRPPHGREAHRLAAHRRPADADPVVGRQRLARRPACRSSRTPSPRSPTTPGPCTTAWTSASTTGRTSTGSLFHVRARHRRRRRAATTRSSARAGSPPTSASPRARSRPRTYFGAVADVPRHLRLELAGDEAAGRHPDLPRRRRVRGRLPVRGLPGRARAGAAACSRR